MTAILLALVTVALGMDGSGIAPARDAGEVVQPRWSWSADLPEAGDLAAGLRLELVDEPLVRTVLDGEQVDRQVVLGSLVGVDLGAVVGIHDRVSLAVGLPLWSVSGAGISGFAVGDLRLDAPVSLLPGHLAAVPWVSLPTGDASRFVGTGGVAGGLDLAGGLSARRLYLGAQAGLALRPEAEVGLPGGPELRASGWAGWLAADWLAVLGEVRGSWSEAAAAPVEAGLSARARLGPGLLVGVSAGRGLTDAPASPALRVSAGFTWTHQTREEELPVVAEDSAPAQLRVVDADGRPVRGARVGFAWEALGTTDHLGVFELPAGLEWGTGVQVSAAGYEPALLDGVPAGGTLVLDWASVQLSLRVLDPEGALLQADVDLVGPSAPEAALDEVGTRTYLLEPGRWGLSVAAPGFGPQERTLVVERGRTEAIHVDAILYPEVVPSTQLTIQVRDPGGAPVEDAFLSLDGRPLGNTGPGGDVVVRGLAPSTSSLEVTTGGLEGAVLSEVVIGAEAEVVDVVLDWVPGSVRVRARGPEGATTDALVRFSGPAELSPARLGLDGERVFVLRPGPWRALLSSPSLGAQERDFHVPEDAEPVVLDFVLQPLEQGSADLVLRVVDPDGEALPGVEVSLDGLLLGTTSSAGSVHATGLAMGPRAVSIRGEDLRAWSGDLRLVEGLQEVDVPMAWEPGMLRVSAAGPAGEPVDALIRLGGPGDVPPTQLGSDGTHRFRLEPGRWDLLVSHLELGMQSRSLVLEADSREMLHADVRLAPPERGASTLSVLVADPADVPIPGVEVTLDGVSVGRTSGAGVIQLSGLRGGTRDLVATAHGYTVARATVVLGQDPADVILTLDPAGAMLGVAVTGQGGRPARDAILRLSGPHPVGVLTVDEGGRRQVALGPGVWELLVSSVRWGMAQRSLEVGEGQGAVDLYLALGQEEEGVAVLVLRVRDEDGSPVGGAPVGVGGEPLGVTSSSGSWLGSNLVPGPTRVTVGGGGQTLSQELLLTLAEGSHQRVVVLPWPRARVRVRVLGPDGHEADAELRLVGPESLPPASTGADGAHDLELRPGRWTVHAAVGELVGSAQLEVAPGVAEAALTIDLAQARVRLSAEVIEHDLALHFDTGSADLLPEGMPVLEGVAEVIRASAGLVSVEVQGHTDDVGGVMYNLHLSERRATEVRDALVALGVPPEVLVSRGYGLLRPVADNETDEGRARNRRVEFRVLEQHRVASPPPVSERSGSR